MFFEPTFYGSYFIPMLLKVLLAVVAGGVVGLERELHGRPAGLRTHMLVSVGSCLMMIVSEGMFFKYGHLLDTGVVRLDPGRIAAQIITGIGFIGAGVIIKEGATVRGLTTAASLWVMAGIGMSFGMGMVNAGVLGTVVAISVLILLKRLEPTIKKIRFLRLTVVASCEHDIYLQLEQILSDEQLSIIKIEQELNLDERRVTYDFTVTRRQQRVDPKIVDLIAGIEGVKKIRYK